MLERAFSETVNLIEVVIPKMLLSMILASLLYSTPQFRRLSSRVVSTLKIKSSTVLLAFLASKVLALSILAEMNRREIVKEKEVLATCVIGVFPMSVRGVLLLIAPVSISTLGLKLGLMYSGLELLSKFIVALIGFYLFRDVLIGDLEREHSLEISVVECIIGTLKQFLRVVLVFIPTVFFVSILLSFISIKTDQVVVIAGTGSTVAGLSIAGSLLAKGEIDERSLMISLFIAMALHRLIEGMRFSMPINVSLFGSKLGVRLTIVNVFVNELACLIAITLLFFSFALGLI